MKIMERMVTIVWFIFLMTYGTSIIEGKSPTKIIGGIPGSIENYPYHVSLLYQGHFICSGSILTQSFILTTASCVTFEPHIVAGNLRIVSGTDDRFDNSRGYIHNVRFIILHEYYEPSDFWLHDISILKLEAPITCSKVHSQIRLPINYSKYRYNVFANGWENRRLLITDNGLYSGSARYMSLLEMTIAGRQECKDICCEYGYIQNSQNCALANHRYGAVTWGDGGGAVSDSNRITLGIVSIFINQQKSRTIVFTRARSYTEWLKEMTLKY